MNLSITTKIVFMLVVWCICIPVTASSTTVKAVYVGGSGTSYAVDAKGDVWVWGAFQGQKYVHPTKVSFIDNVAIVAPGHFGDAIVLKEDGTVWAWGSVPAKQNGSYPGQNNTTPTQINISTVKSVTNTGNTVYMVKTDGSLWMCGDELCLGLDDILNGNYTLDPVELPISNVSKVVATISFVLVEKNDGSWWGWGENRDYQLNDDTNIRRESPVQMQLNNVTSVGAQTICFGVNDEYVSESSVLALNNSGQVYGWGDNIYGISGDSKYPTYSNVSKGLGYILSSPHPVPMMSNVMEIGSGVSYYVALKNDGTVWAWGKNPGSGGGPSLDSNTPVKLTGFTNIVSISVGYQHLLAIKKDGTVWAWGYNMNGELGNGKISTFGGESQAVQVIDLYVDFPSRTDAAIVSSTPTQVPGFNLNTLSILGCLFITAGLLSGIMRRKDR